MSEKRWAGPVVVTGASGYVASWVVRYLLDEGATVRATVRDASRDDKVGHLRALAETRPGTLELHEADLLVPGSFDEIVRGASVVMHTASPFLVGKVKDAEAQLVRPALAGTENVLDAVERAGTVRRVVLTSSVVAIYGDAAELTERGVASFDDTHWNLSSSADYKPYPYSKTVAERAAWARAEAAEGWDLVTIHPGFVFGPSLTQRVDSASIDFVRMLCTRSQGPALPEMHTPVVDVRDVARAHLEAAAKPEARGRYILSAASMSLPEVARVLAIAMPGAFPYPTLTAPTWLMYLAGPFLGFSWREIRRNFGIPLAFDTARTVDELGVRFRAPRETLTEHVAQLVADGLVPEPRVPLQLPSPS